jgi:hypothetical protein
MTTNKKIKLDQAKIDSYLIKKEENKVFSLVEYNYDRPGLDFGIVANKDLWLNTTYEKFKFVIGNIYLHNEMIKSDWSKSKWKDRCKWWRCKLYFQGSYKECLEEFSKNCCNVYDKKCYNNELIKNDICICNDCKCIDKCFCSAKKVTCVNCPQ